MKKVKFRANSAILLALLLLLGLCIYLVRLADHGAAWAMFSGNQGIYTAGILDTGTITDRNGIVLAKAGNGSYAYADDGAVRRALLHVIGDYPGNIGTGVLSALAAEVVGYSFLNGTYHREGTGRTLHLTIDAELSKVALDALGGRHGAVLLSNYKTGEILCMVSSPTYDPQSPPSGLDSESQYEGVYLNRNISGTFPPGSVFKIITLAAAIEHIPELYTRSFLCEGSVTIGGERIQCSGVHGTQTIEQAFSNSCNTVFATLSVELGADLLAEYAEKYDLCSQLSLDGILTAAGQFEKAEQGSGALAWSGIGQDKDLITPYAMLRLCSAIAGEGEAYEPTLLKKNVDSILGNLSQDKVRILEKDTAIKVKEIMSYAGYTYSKEMFQGMSLCAKTGTAEVDNGAPHAWFTGFLTDSSHPYAFTVMVENGGTGLSAAGVIADKLLKAVVAQ